MIYLAILAAALVIGGLLLFSLLAKNMAPGSKRLTMETKRMKEDMDEWVTKLVPIDKEELELFSLGQDKQVLRKGVTTTAKGIFITIYHEPILAYSYREYLGKANKPNALLYARTAEHEYTYWIRKGAGTLFIDGQEVGLLSDNGVLKGKRSGKVIAQLKPEAGNLLPVEIGGREVGSLSKTVAKGDKGLQERAFSFLRNDISDKEEQLFIALALEELVSRAVR
jgi:hypothetical protein